MSNMHIRPAKCVRGEILLPGDKSISHRAAIIAAMAEGETRIDNFATSVDCAATLECLRQLGVGVRHEGITVWVDGVGKSGFSSSDKPLDCGNSGTTMRLMAGVLAGQNFKTVLTGDDSLRERPMKRVIEPLASMGSNVESDGGRAPLTVHGVNPLRATEYELPVASAQIKSCVLLAGLNAEGKTSVIESTPTRDHTERMLRWFGVEVIEEEEDRHKRRISLKGEDELTGRGLAVPADISSATFFMVAATCLDQSIIRMPKVGLNPTRTAIIEVLTRKLGASVNVSERSEVNNEPVGDISVRGRLKPQRSNEITGRLVANLIDELPALAVLATQLEYGLMVRDAAELRVKETDRIAAVVENLRRMGADVEEFDDGFRVGKSNLKGARIDSFGDHRIAMAFAIAGLLAMEGETEIIDAECVDVSFPGFFETLQNVVVYE
jgi:3-phosphoshikimate 1-carboxyvinyltransferase